MGLASVAVTLADFVFIAYIDVLAQPMYDAFLLTASPS